MLAANLLLRFNYWFLPALYGIADVPRERLVDFDEAALFIESGNRSKGKVSVARQVCKVGPNGHSERMNVCWPFVGSSNSLAGLPGNE